MCFSLESGFFLFEKEGTHAFSMTCARVYTDNKMDMPSPGFLGSSDMLLRGDSQTMRWIGRLEIPGCLLEGFKICLRDGG
jgi:hypothetical protein